MNLTKTADIARKAISVSVGLLVSYWAFVIFMPILSEFYLTLIPPKTPPNPIYGLLDPLEFIGQPISNTSVKYELNTKNGRLPTNLPKVVTVYRYARPKFSYSAGKDAQNDAGTLGFSDNNLITNLKSDTYEWKDTRYDSGLEIKINSGELKKDTTLSGKAQYYLRKGLNEFDAVEIAKDLFLQLNRFDDNLYAQGKQRVTLGKFLGVRIVRADSSPEARIARVDFFRSINKTPILGPNPKEGLLYAIVSPTKSLKDQTFLQIPQILQNPIVEAHTRKIETQSNASYPLISINSAWEAVLSGDAIISNVAPRGKNPFEEYARTRVDTILVNDIYIAYYDNKKAQNYLQPIYVFEGNYTNTAGERGDITLYLPAVQSKYTKNQSQ